MKQFRYLRPSDPATAIAHGATPEARYLGGGTNLVDLMRAGIEQPLALVDVTSLSTAVEGTADGGLRIGAAVTNTALATDRNVRAWYPLLAQAIVAGASPQIRNMATVGGNILQRTRCSYFCEGSARCNKRMPGSGCDALEGANRMHAILGASSECVAVHPSDMCVALAALDAVVTVEGAEGRRDIAFVDLHRLPDQRPDLDTVLGRPELITAVTLPPVSGFWRWSYRKVRDRASYAFALVSVAAGMNIRDGSIHDVRLALGGVAHKPWRARRAEAFLKGQAPTVEAFREAARLELLPATALRENAFKIELAQQTLVETLDRLAKPAGS